MPPPSIQGYVCAAVGFAVGILCLLQTQAATKEWMDPFVSSCTDASGGGHSSSTVTLVPYNPKLGGAFVCMITQFLHALAVEYPGGLLTWGGVMVVSFPYSVFAAIEAGRMGAKGPIRYSVIMGLLAQFFGVCVVMPMLWIPSYVLGGSRDGAFDKNRPLVGVLTSIPATLLAIGIFVLNPSSEWWKNCAGILGGPVVALLPLVYYLSPTPTDATSIKLHSEAAKANYVKAYQFMGLLSLAGWGVLVYNAWLVYGGSSDKSLLQDLWWEAHPAVKFMTIDTTGFFIASLLYAYLRSPGTFVKTVLLTPLVGPGAALSFVMTKTEPAYEIPAKGKVQ